jgi:integrase
VARLTKRVVDGAPVRLADYFIWCSDLPGFGARIYPSGKRGYLVQYRADGRTRRAKIGLHGHLTCEEARKQAMALLGQVAKGEDPAEERLTKRRAMTVRELCDRYKTALEKGLIFGKRGLPKKTLTILSDLGRIDRHIIPLLGSRRARDLTSVDVARFIRDVMQGKTAVVEKTAALRGKAVVKGGRGTAARSAGLLGGILSFAVSEGVIESNPATGVRKPASESRTARLSPSDYRALGIALDAAAEEGVNPTAVAAVRLLAITGCRKGEVLGLRWREVDEPGRAFRLIDSKEGASVRPIGSAAFAILAKLQRPEVAQWVLPGERRDLPYAGLKGVWRKLVQRAELSGVTLHTLRHSFASVAGDLGYAESTIGALLGHASGTVTGRYTHILDSVLIAAADHVASTIHGYMTDEALQALARPTAQAVAALA